MEPHPSGKSAPARGLNEARGRNGDHPAVACREAQAGVVWRKLKIRTLAALTLVVAVVTMGVPLPVNAAEEQEQQSGHLVSVQELHDTLAARAAERVRNTEEVRTLLRQDLVQQQVGHLASLEQIEQAIPRLDDETLWQLAKDSRHTNDQIEAGISTAAVLIIAAAVVVLVVFHILEFNVGVLIKGG